MNKHARFPRRLTAWMLPLSLIVGMAPIPGLAQDIHEDLIPNQTPKVDPLVELLTPTLSNPELFYHEAWERTTRAVANPQSSDWFTVILAILPGPDGDFKAHEWLATHAAEKLEAGVYIFPGPDGSVQIGGGLFKGVVGAIQLARTKQVRLLSGSSSPLIQQLGTMSREMAKPSFPVSPPLQETAQSDTADGTSATDETAEAQTTETNEAPTDVTTAADEANSEGGQETIAEDTLKTPDEQSAPVEPSSIAQRNNDDPLDSLTSDDDTSEGPKLLNLSDQLLSLIGMGGSDQSQPQAATAQPPQAPTPTPAETVPSATPASPSNTGGDTSSEATPSVPTPPEPEPTHTDNPVEQEADSDADIDDLFVSHNTSAGSLDDLMQDAAPPAPTAPARQTPAPVDKSAETTAAKPVQKSLRPWPPNPKFEQLMASYRSGQRWLRDDIPAERLTVQVSFLSSPSAEESLDWLLRQAGIAEQASRIYVFRSQKFTREALLVAFGDFKDSESARQAILAMPENFHRNQFLIRSVGKLRADVVHDPQ